MKARKKRLTPTQIEILELEENLAQTQVQMAQAYAGFNAAMGRREKLRFALTRGFRGLGDFEQIP